MWVVAWTSLGRYIDSLERDGELLRIAREVDVELEAGTIADLLVKTGGPAVIFEKPRLPDGTISDIPLAMNIFGSHSRTMKALGAKGKDEFGYRAEFIELTRLAETAEAQAALNRPAPEQ